MPKKAKIKTIDVNCKEWFDRVNGNSYFAGSVTINYGMKTQKTFKVPFQYGYGNQYEHEAMRTLQENGYFKNVKYPFSELKSQNIIYRHNIEKNCLKRELTALDKMEY